MLVKDFVNSCSIGTKVEVQSLINGEIKVSELERGSGAVKCSTKDYLDIYELEIIFFRARDKDEMAVYCGEWK